MADLPEWMGGNGSTSTATDDTPKSNLPDWMNSDQTAPLTTSLKAGSTIPPEQAATVLNLRDKTSLPTSFISRNVKPLEDQQKANVDPSTIHPRLADWIVQDPHNAALVTPDLTPLSNIARQFDYLAHYTENGLFGMERSGRGIMEAVGKGSPENQQRIGQLDQRLQDTSYTKTLSPASRMIGSGAIESLPQFLAAVGTGAAGAQVGIPPNATLAAIYGAGEFGNAYLDYSKRPGVTSDEARGYAMVSGLGTAAATIALGPLVEKIPAFKMLNREGLSSIIESPVGRKALAPLLTELGKGGLSMTTFSQISGLIHSAAGHLAENKKELPNMTLGGIISTMFPKKDLIASIKEIPQQFATGSIFAGGMEGMNTLNHYQNYHNAMAVKQAYEGIGKTIESTNLYKMAPEQLVNVMKTVAPGNVWMPMEAWQAHWTKMGVDPREAYIHAGGRPETYSMSMRSGADLPIDNAHYSLISVGEHGKALNDFVRDEPSHMNADEAGTSIKLLDDVEKEREAERNKGPVERTVDKAKEVLGLKEPEPLPDKELTKMALTSDPEEKATLQAQYQQGMRPMFQDPKMAGMSEEQAQRYYDAIQRNSADVLDKRSQALTARKERMLGEERSDLVEQYTEQLNQDKRYRALSILQDGKLPNGEEAPLGLHGLKLNENAVYEMFPDIPTSQFPRGILSKDGATPDNAAEVLGFNSGPELIHRLITMPDKATEVGRMADEEMNRRHGTLQEELPRLAQEAIHNDSSLRVQMMEWRHLNSEAFATANGLVKALGRRVMPEAEIKQQARDMVGDQRTVDTKPDLYLRQEALANEEAHNLLTKGDIGGAFDAKGRAILNHEMYRQAVKAQDQLDKDLSYAQKGYSNTFRAKLGKAGGTYLEQRDDLMERFDFGKVTNKALEKRQSLREFVDEQKAQGKSITVPNEILNEAYRKSWKEMTNDELHNVVDLMRTIDKRSGLKNKLLSLQKTRDYEETMEGINGALDKNFNLTPEKLDTAKDLTPEFAEKVKGGINTYGAYRTRMEPLFNFLAKDRFDSPIREEIFGRLNPAEDVKTKGLREINDKIGEVFDKNLTNWEKAGLGGKEYIPELEGSKITPYMNKQEMIFTLCHSLCGNGMEEMKNGYRMSENQLRAIWKRLAPEHIEIAKGLMDMYKPMWERIKEQSIKYNGLPPEAVEPHPLDVTLKDGSTVHLDGGFFNLDYDQRIEERRIRHPDDKDLFNNASWQTMGKPDYEKARVGGGGQAPSLKYSSYINNLYDMNHVLAYKDAVTDILKIITNPEFKSRVATVAGKGVEAQLLPWLKDIAGDRNWDALSGVTEIASRHMTLAELGGKVTASFIHTSSIFPAAREIGWGYFGKGVKEFYANPSETFKFITSKSEFMNSRYDNFDREWRAVGGKKNFVNLEGSKYLPIQFIKQLEGMAPDTRAYSVALMKYMDMAIAAPTWYGAYMRAMDGKVKGVEAMNEPDSIAYADQLVRDTKGSGAAKDLAPIQRQGGSLGRLLSLFYTQISVQDNQLLKGYRDYRNSGDLGKVAATFASSWFAPALIVELAKGRTPKNDESWLAWAAKAEAKYPLNLMFGAREALNFFQRGKAEITPLEEGAATIFRTAKNIVEKNPMSDQEWTEKDYADAVMSVGYLKGWPTRQLVQSSERLHGWVSGSEEHSNPIEGAWRVLIGNKKPE